MIDPLRIRSLNDAPVRPDREWVLYWMVSSRRIGFNPALERAAAHARALKRPLLVLDAVECDYPWANARFHACAIGSLWDLAARFQSAGIAHYPYVEPEPGAARGLLAALAAQACVVVTDDSPAFFFPRSRAAAARRLDVALEAVDGVGLLPVRAAPRGFLRAVDFRRHLASALPTHLGRFPLADSLSEPLPRAPSLPAAVTARWPLARPGDPLPAVVDRSVAPVAWKPGETAAIRDLRSFVARLDDYTEDRRHPDREGTSRLSPALHWGHLSVHAIWAEIADRCGVDVVAGWEGLPEPHRNFLDELVTWRELTHNTAAFLPNYDAYDSLPWWALESSAKHAGDPRPYLYEVEDLETASTHDPVWNAAQRQLVAEGRIHNYLRMVWGKKVLEWSPSPEEGFRTLLHLNNRYAIDGRDPNSVGGIAWVFGRYDRPWGPERPIFGLIRYMSSEATVRKVKMKEYLRNHQ